MPGWATSAGRRSCGAGRAHANPFLRLQTAVDLKRLLPDVQPHQRRTGDRAGVTAHGICTADGTEHTVDTIVLATGFNVDHYLSALDVTGRGGLQIDDAWDGGAQAYKGTATVGSRTCSCSTAQTPTAARPLS